MLRFSAVPLAPRPLGAAAIKKSEWRRPCSKEPKTLAAVGLDHHVQPARDGRPRLHPRDAAEGEECRDRKFFYGDASPSRAFMRHLSEHLTETATRINL